MRSVSVAAFLLARGILAIFVVGQLFTANAVEHDEIDSDEANRLCGINGLYQVYKWTSPRNTHTYDDLRAMANYDAGLSLQELLRISEALGLRPAALRVHSDYFFGRDVASVVMLVRPNRRNHYIVVWGSSLDPEHVYVSDYPADNGVMTRDEFLSGLTRWQVDASSLPVVSYVRSERLGSHEDDLTFEPSRLDITDGDAWNLRDQEIQFKAMLHNTTDAMTKVESLKASCGCTRVSIDRESIPPNSTAIVTGTVVVYPGFSRSITIQALSNKDVPPAILHIKAELSSPLRLSPPILEFGEVAPGETKTLSSDVFVWAIDQLDLEAVHGPPPKAEYRIETELFGPWRVNLGDRQADKYSVRSALRIDVNGSGVHRDRIRMVFRDTNKNFREYEIPLTLRVLRTASD